METTETAAPRTTADIKRAAMFIHANKLRISANQLVDELSRTDASNALISADLTLIRERLRMLTGIFESL